MPSLCQTVDLRDLDHPPFALASNGDPDRGHDCSFAARSHSSIACRALRTTPGDTTPWLVGSANECRPHEHWYFVCRPSVERIDQPRSVNSLRMRRVGWSLIT